MKIKTRLQLNIWFFLGVTVLMVLSLAWTFWKIQLTDRNEEIVSSLRKLSFERILLRDEYLLYQEDRPRQQWLAKSETLKRMLEAAKDDFTTVEDRALLLEAHQDFDATHQVFSEILKRHTHRERRSDRFLALDEGESRLIGQVVLKAYALQDNINRLYEYTEQDSQKARNQGVALVVIVVLSGGMLLMLNTVFTGSIIAKRLASLQSGLELMGSGNLDHRIDAAGDDEHADLARIANAMSSRLKESHTTVEILQREIAMRRSAEETLTVLSSYQEALLEAIPDIIMEVNPDKIYTWANQAGLNFFGPDVIGKEASFYFEGEQHTYDIVSPLFKGDENVILVESLQRRKDGEKRILSWRCRMIKDDTGNVQSVLSSAHDITERKQAEETLREINERLSMALDVGNAGVWEWDLKTDEVRLDDRFHALLGYAPGELPDTIQEWLPYHHPGDIPVWRSKAEAYLKGKSPTYESEHRIRSKAGDWNWVFTRGKIVKYSFTGSPELFVGIAMNITERKQVDEALRESEQRFSESFRLSPIAMTLTSVTDYTFYDVNEVFLLNSGYTKEEVLGKSSADLGLFALTQERELIIAEVMKHGSVYGMPCKSRRKDGSIHECLISTGTISISGKGYFLSAILDITERKRAEEALLESEERFRGVFEHASIGMSLTLPDGTLMKINRALAHMLGHTIEEVERLNLVDFTHPDDVAESRECIRSFQASERTTYRMEKRYFHKDGHIVWADVSTTFHRDAQGHPLYLITSIMDITQSKLMEDELKQSEERFRAIFDSTSDPIVVWDRNYNYIYANRSAIDHVGTTSDKVIGKNIKDGLGHIPDFMRLWMSRIDHVFETKQVIHYDDALLVGERFEYSESSVSPINDGHGNIIAVGVIYRNITERKQAEEALLLAHERLRRFVDSNIIGVVISSSSGRVIEANDYYLRTIGYTREELEQGMVDWRAITPPEWLPADEHALEELLERGTCSPYEKEYVRRDGTRAPVFLTDAMLPGPDKLIAAFVLDITQRKLDEKKIISLNESLEQRVIERTAQLEAANKELEAFSYSVSHDLRAPLRALDGYSRILLEDYDPLLDAEGKRLCSVISANARTMGKLIDDLLAFSRIGRTAMKPSRVDMAALVNSIFFELITPEHRGRIDFNVAHLPQAKADPALLRQVWINLLGNALKFSSKKERAVIEVASEERGGEVIYSIRDNGAGFDMRYADKLFGVFQRLHSTKEFEGTGVGLAIVQRIVQRHGGRVWAEGEPGKGAVFYFTVNPV